MKTTTNAELLTLAREVAVAAGELVARLRAVGVSVADLKSSPVDVVTLADRQAEELIKGMLASARPDDGFFGEESAAVAGTSGLTWVVDPIDGTVNYLYGIPNYAVSVAVVEGQPDPLTWNALAGCVVNPVTGEVFTASTGGGAFLGAASISAAPPVVLAQALVGTGFSYDSETRGRQGELVARLLPEVRDIRRGGSAALDLCFVANGRLNAYFETGLNPWDHAAGALIATEAGAVVTGLHGKGPSHEFLLAGRPEVAEALGSRLISFGMRPASVANTPNLG